MGRDSSDRTAPGSPIICPSLHWGRATSWILYDLANTIYAASITYLFVPFFGARFQSLSAVGLTQTLTMIVSAGLAVILAAVSDRTGRSVRYLAIATLVCIASMAAWALSDAQWALLSLLAIGGLAYQVAIVFYDSLLASVAPTERAGLVSGLGVGFGYFGTIITIGVALFLQNRFQMGFAAASVAAAGLFFATSLPCLMFVRERRVASRASLSRAMILEQISALWSTAKKVRHQRVLLCFFVGNFFLVDVLNTAIFYFATFTRDIFRDASARGELVFVGFAMSGDTFAMIMGLILCSLALVFGLLTGLMADWTSPLSVMRAAGWCLLSSLLISAWAGGVNPIVYALAMGLLGAFGLSGIWTAGRKALILLSPRAELGQYFGLYGVTNKVSVLGSTTFAVISDVAYWHYSRTMSGDAAVVSSQRVALGAQILPLLLGLWFLYRIRSSDVRQI